MSHPATVPGSVAALYRPGFPTARQRPTARCQTADAGSAHGSYQPNKVPAGTMPAPSVAANIAVLHGMVRCSTFEIAAGSAAGSGEIFSEVGRNGNGRMDACEHVGEEMPTGMNPPLRSAERMEALKEVAPKANTFG